MHNRRGPLVVPLSYSKLGVSFRCQTGTNMRHTSAVNMTRVRLFRIYSDKELTLLRLGHSIRFRRPAFGSIRTRIRGDIDSRRVKPYRKGTTSLRPYLNIWPNRPGWFTCTHGGGADRHIASSAGFEQRTRAMNQTPRTMDMFGRSSSGRSCTSAQRGRGLSLCHIGVKGSRR